MSILDDDIVRAIGAVTSGFRVEIPLYMRVQSPPAVLPSQTPLPGPLHRDISVQSLAAIILEIPDMSQLQRFLALPTLLRSGRRPSGPACRTLYHVSPLDAGADADLDFPSLFHSELSHAHSQLFFLKPHALALSMIERKPILDYFDHELYESACHLYPNNPVGPLEDLDRCDPCNRNWTRLYIYNELV